jgi:predicted DNA binding protein
MFILVFVQGGTWTGAEPWWQRMRERWQERKVVTIDGGARAYPRRSSKRKARKVEFAEENIDSILDKISEKGMDSLTDKEREALAKAAKK